MGLKQILDDPRLPFGPDRRIPEMSSRGYAILIAVLLAIVALQASAFAWAHLTMKRDFPFLKSRLMFPGTLSLPCNEHHFFGMTVYHEGDSSGDRRPGSVLACRDWSLGKWYFASEYQKIYDKR